MNYWFTSDTHFNGERTLNLSKRPFKSVDEMNKTLINNWNSLVDKKDIVYHLGDFGDYNFRKELNGYIILVKGNYERFDGYPNTILENKFGFAKVYDDILIDEVVNYRWINMAHEPSKVRDLRGINLFGHIHKLCMIKPYGINVGVDCHNFSPINLDTVNYYHNALVNFYDDEVFK